MTFSIKFLRELEFKSKFGVKVPNRIGSDGYVQGYVRLCFFLKCFILIEMRWHNIPKKSRFLKKFFQFVKVQINLGKFSVFGIKFWYIYVIEANSNPYYHYIVVVLLMEIQSSEEVFVIGSGRGTKFTCKLFLYCSNIPGTEFKMKNNLCLLTCNSQDKSKDCFAINSSYSNF